MLDHVGVTVADLAVSRAFYDAALKPLGLSVQMAVTAEETGGKYEGLGFGTAGKPGFWLSRAARPLSGPIHLAFTAADRKSVDAFYAAAMASGGRDNGAPGLRAHYHPNYYGAFVLDPDGNNIEAVCHRPE
jgi:catechol 2,3-dioxygenase-like lactoylglutathione lyase family enzyme